MTATGDTPLPPGAPPRHVDTSGEVSVQPQGDRPLPGYVGPVEVYDPPHPTAGQLRAAGYVVFDTSTGPVPDDQAPGLYYADTPAAPPAPPVAEVEAEPVASRAAAEARPDPDYEAGRAAAEAHKPRSENPHDGRSARGRAWLEGWKSGRPENGTED